MPLTRPSTSAGTWPSGEPALLGFDKWAVEGRATGAGAGAGAAVQRTRKDRVAQLDLLDDDRAHVVLELL